MNIASIAPAPAAAPATGGGNAAAEQAPSGFLDVLAAHVAVRGDAATTDAGVDAGPGAADEGAAGTVDADLLELAALASRAANAVLPLVVPSDAAAPDASGADVDAPATAGGAVRAPGAAGPVTADVATDDALAGTATPVATGPSGGHAGAVTTSGTDVPRPTGGAGATVVDGAEASTVPADGNATAVDGADRSAPAVDAAVPPARAGDQSRSVRPDPGAGRPTGDGPGEAEVAVASDEVAVRSDAVPGAAPVERARGRADAPSVRPSGDGPGVSSVDGPEAAAAQPAGTAPAGRADAPATSSAAQRILDIVSQLEDAPPPRVVVIETGEIRVRVGLDAGTVRLTVLGPLDQSGEQVLREAAEALDAGGFSTELGREAGDGAHEERPAHDRDAQHPFPTPVAARRASGRRAGLQL